MKEFALLFRQPRLDSGKVSPTEMEALAKKWKDWKDGISNQDKLASAGERLALEGKVLKPGGVITDGPFVELREILGGFIVVKADDLDEAITLAHGCPVLANGGTVEVRPIYGS